MLIAHIADIHIRALSRHPEFKKILEYFVEDCKKRSVDHVFIGGDLFHQKTGISAEYVDFLSWWLTLLSKIVPVHIILGNHDGNVVNLSRQDAVSPVVTALKNDAIHLYKNSGTYSFDDGFNFCVYSLFDEENWDKVNPTEGQINIACYHGPVRGSSTEVGWEVEDGLSVDFFKKYDFCFLGDIHRFQFLDFRDGKPWIAYAGSAIQQNYGEDETHGYLLWDIDSAVSWNVEFVELPNPLPYVTVDWMGSVEKTVEEARRHPQGSRFRIKANSILAQDDVHYLSEKLKTSMSASEVTYKTENRIDTKTVSAGKTKLERSDLRSPDVISNLLRDYFDGKDVSAEDLDEIVSSVKHYVSTMNLSDEVARNSKWSLRSVTWDNLFSYGEGNSLDFEKLNGIVGIFGQNTAGKSAVVGSIMYTLFNTTDRGPMKNLNVCNVRKPYCASKAVFDHDGSTYVVERQTTKKTDKKGAVSATTALNLFKVIDGKLVDQHGEQRTDTEKVIRSLIGTAEDFMLTSLSAQNETNQFISLGSTKRRSILSRFLDLDVFDKLYDVVNKDSLSLKAQLKNFPSKDWDEEEKNNIDVLSEYAKKIEDLEAESAEASSNLNVLKYESSKCSGPVVTEHDVEASRAIVDHLKNKKLPAVLTSLSDEENEVRTLREKLETVQKMIDSVDVDDMRQKLESQKKLENSIALLKSTKSREEVVLSQKRKSLEILEDVPCGDFFPKCKFIKNAHADKLEEPKQAEEVEKVRRALRDAEASLDSVIDTTLASKIEKHWKAVSLKSQIESEISERMLKIKDFSVEKQSVERCLSEADDKLRVLEAALKNQENAHVVSIREKIRDLSDVIKKCDSERMSLAEKSGKLRRDIEKQAEEKKMRGVILKKLRICELISAAFSKKGLPLFITKSQLPAINAEVSQILHGIVDFTVVAEIDEDTDTLELYIDYGDSKRFIELCSGMEKVVSSLALRVAMVNVSTLPKPDFFIIDEGFGSLDSSRVEEVNRLLTSLKKYFKTCLVITHVDGIKDAVDNILEITKVEKDSKLEC